MEDGKCLFELRLEIPLNMLKILDEHYIAGFIQIKKQTPNFKNCVLCKYKHGKKTGQMFVPFLKYYNFTRVYEGQKNL